MKLKGEIRNNITAENQQEWYNKIEKAILKPRQKFGKEREEIKTDDKFSESTKKVINERNEMRFKIQRNVREKIKIAELNKIVRRKIRKDLKQWEDGRIQEIIEKNGSTRRMRNELCEGHQLITRK